jgi:hypothetical protein
MEQVLKWREMMNSGQLTKISNTKRGILKMTAGLLMYGRSVNEFQNL